MGFYGLVALIHYTTLPNDSHVLAKSVSFGCSTLNYSMTRSSFLASLDFPLHLCTSVGWGHPISPKKQMRRGKYTAKMADE